MVNQIFPHRYDAYVTQPIAFPAGSDKATFQHDGVQCSGSGCFSAALGHDRLVSRHPHTRQATNSPPRTRALPAIHQNANTTVHRMCKQGNSSLNRYIKLSVGKSPQVA